MFHWSGLQPELAWGLYTRGLGVVCLCVFASLSLEVPAWCGTHGVRPVAAKLERIARDFPGFRRWLYFPSLLWLNRSDAMLRALPVFGVCASALVIWGGPVSFWALLACYPVYLSLDVAMSMNLPWESMLYECLILALWLPPTLPLPEIAALQPPSAAIAWAHRLLLFRVMFGFGKQKFLGSTSKDLAYLKGFLLAQPLPSLLGWYMQKLPTWLLKQALLFMFFVEVIAPFFALVPGPASNACALATALLMVGICAGGNYGHFNWLVIVACLPLTDNLTPRQLLDAPAASPLSNGFLLLYALGSVFTLPFNSWVTERWHVLPAWYRLPAVLQWPLHCLRLLHPLRWLHPYGALAPNVGPSLNVVPVEMVRNAVSIDVRAVLLLALQLVGSAPTIAIVIIV